MQSNQSRDRGRILTPEALTKLEQAILAWETQNDRRCTYECLKELTSRMRPGGLDTKTLGKIRKAIEKVDPESIRILFQALGLELQEADLISTARLSDPLAPATPQFDLLGREDDRTALQDLSKKHKIVLIKAGAGIGKSTLAREFLQTQFKKVIQLKMGLESGNVTSAEEKVSQILRKDFDEEPSRDFGINLDILQEKLSDRANPVGVLIDNLEPALDENYRFRENLRGYDDLLAVLSDRDVYSFTLITSRRSLITPRAKVHEYSLEGLDITAWRQYFHDCENVETSETLLQMRDAYNGNAKVMDILNGAIKNRFNGNIEAYWSRYKNTLLADPELETLISVEMDWLRDHQPDAYNLLCRMGCYRYQDVKTVPFEGLLCLLWDVPEDRQVWVVDYLSKTSLIEVRGEYYLHPTIQQTSKNILKDKDKTDWDLANRRAAEFWSRSVSTIQTIDEATRAFEAYYQYLQIDDIDSACRIIMMIRKNNISSSNLTEPLGISFRRLGLLQVMIIAIEQILTNAKETLVLANCLHLIGDLSWMTGRFHNGISYHEKSGNIANCFEKNNVESTIVNESKNIYYSSLLSRGICYLYLQEIDESLKFFLHLKNLLRKLNEIEMNLFRIHMFRVNYWLSYTYSILKDIDNTLLCIEETIEYETNYEVYSAMTRGYSLFFLGQAYKNICFFEKSKIQYLEAIKYANQAPFPQVEAMSLYGIGELDRLNANYYQSIKNIEDSINILKKTTAIPDLAEAHFQLGLTYQSMGKHEQAKEYKEKALELFEQMEAPKQIERVNKAFEQGAIK